MPERLDRKELALLRDRLQQGDHDRISKATGKSPKTVYNTLYGLSWNEQVIEEAIKLAQKNEASKAELARRINILASVPANSLMVA